MNRLTEMTVWEGVTAEGGVFRNVKILGQRSRNKRFYTGGALRSAVPLYEGKAVYISHAGEKVKHRPMPERYGRLQNVRFVEGARDGAHELRGDLVYLESQEQVTRMVKEDLERRLNFFGLSHVADGQWRMQKGIQMVQQIDRVATVDLVSDPATASSLLEQEDAPAAAPVADAGPDPKVEALRGGLMAILDAGGDLASLVAKIEEFLATMKGDGKGDKPADKPAEEQTLVAQVAKLTEQVAELSKAAKPRKYVTAPAGPAGRLTEQADPAATAVDAPPKDKAALKKWLRK